MQSGSSLVKRLSQLALPLLLLVVAILSVQPAISKAVSTQIDLVGPAGSGQFGKAVFALPNGNIVVTDPGYSVGANTSVGAVYLYDGHTGALISALTGSTTNDRVGHYGIVPLGESNYVVRSPNWTNSTATKAGAVTWCSGTSGCSGVVSSANSLVGSTANDQVGYYYGATLLTNGNYVVLSPNWNNGAAAKAGAVTWCSGTSGCTGVVSSANSLVGSTTNDQVGYSYAMTLTNGNYVVNSPFWTNGAATKAGAVTWCSGTSGCSGVVSSANSLVGSTTNDMVGNVGVRLLGNDNYVVRSPNWTNGTATKAGAVTQCSGTSGCTGVISSTNSLVGSTTNDQVGSAVYILTPGNSNYVVNSPSWNNDAAASAGAITWCNGTLGCTGLVSTTNSLVGNTTNDLVGIGGITVLSNGNYVVRSTRWNNGAATSAGAVTWCNGTLGCTGVVSTTNSLVGSTTEDLVGEFGDHQDDLTTLSNGDYVVRSAHWNNGTAANAGAVTWCDGMTGCTGPVSSANSLVGSTTDDRVGGFAPSGGITELNNGNYVVHSPGWTNGTALMAGAVTWCSGTLGCTGPVASTNSLVGSTTNDRIGGFATSGGITELDNGNYVVHSLEWTNGTATSAGAVTWCSGTLGCTGPVASTNSLVGSTTNDRVGQSGSTLLSNGNYVVNTPYWNNGTAVWVGAVTWCSGTLGCTGVISSTNSLVGSTTDDRLGEDAATALRNGNYVVSAPKWSNGAAAATGAVRWCDGTRGCSGVISTTNSLVGSTTGDQVGQYGITALNNGNYVVLSPNWNNGAVADVGAATWCDGPVGCTGAISHTNSLLGNTANDRLSLGVTTLDNGNYVLWSPYWSNGLATSAGAITWCNGTTSCAGSITTLNSVLGQAASGGLTMTYTFDNVNNQLIVGRPADNRVTLFKLDPPPPTITHFTPASGRGGTNVIITGTNFTRTVGVMFNWTYASDFKVLSSTLLTATVPPSATAGPIRVNTPGGTAASNTDFSIYSSNSWYVASPPLGDDTNDCLSLATPCATVGAAIGKAAADDTINIASGTYTENVTVTLPLHFMGAGANSTIVDGNSAGRVFTILSGTVSIADLTVQHGNTSGDGGGIYAIGALTLTNVTVMNNMASGNGGGLKADQVLNLAGARFLNNTAHQGGGVYLSGNTSAYSFLYNILLAGNAASSGQGNALFANAGSAGLYHGTIVSPTPGSGSAIYRYSGNWLINNTLVASYTIGYQLAEGGHGWYSEYRTLFSGVPTPYVGSSIYTDSTSFSGAAGFVDPIGGNYHLMAGSDAINRGRYAFMATDLDGNPRPVGCGYDIGAYEYQAAPDCMLTMNIAGTGVVTPTVGIHPYAYGATAILTASTSAPWGFGGWSGDASGTSDSVEITIDGDKSVTATFGLAACYATPDNGLTVESSPNATAVQRAANRASDGGTVKVAGTCVGVQSLANLITQTLYLEKPLTLLGGYTVTNWLTSHPLTQPTILDAQHAGCVIRLGFGFALIIADLTVQNGNTAYHGGGIDTDGDLTLINVSVLSNTATGTGGGAWAMGNMTITGGLFQNNQATQNGGGLAVKESLTLTGTRFTNNTANRGGGIYLGGSYRSHNSLTNVILDRNTATSAQGNAIFANFVFPNTGVASLRHGTIVSSSQGNGSAIYGDANDWIIHNTLIDNYTIGYEQALDAQGWIYEYRTLFSDVITPYVGSNIDIDSHSFSGTTGFVDPIGGDYHLTSSSEAINRGMEMSTPIATDFDGKPRPIGCGYDIGVYEYQAGPDCMLTIGVVGTGIVTPTGGIHSYPYGAVVPLTASTSAPWSFAGWSGDVTSPANFASVYMLGDKSVVATFVDHRVYLPLVLR